jgi:hypothetical protein
LHPGGRIQSSWSQIPLPFVDKQMVRFVETEMSFTFLVHHIKICWNSTPCIWRMWYLMMMMEWKVCRIPCPQSFTVPFSLVTWEQQTETTTRNFATDTVFTRWFALDLQLNIWSSWVTKDNAVRSNKSTSSQLQKGSLSVCSWVLSDQKDGWQECTSRHGCRHPSDIQIILQLSWR